MSHTGSGGSLQGCCEATDSVIVCRRRAARRRTVGSDQGHAHAPVRCCEFALVGIALLSLCFVFRPAGRGLNYVSQPARPAGAFIHPSIHASKYPAIVCDVLFDARRACSSARCRILHVASTRETGSPIRMPPLRTSYWEWGIARQHPAAIRLLHTYTLSSPPTQVNTYIHSLRCS